MRRLLAAVLVLGLGLGLAATAHAEPPPEERATYADADGEEHVYLVQRPPVTRDRAASLRESVEKLAFVRHRTRPGELERARAWIEDQLAKAGWKPRREAFTIARVPGVNIRATRTGRAATPRTWIVGAHYDTVVGSPGADDNASGVAGLIELARMLRDARFEDTVELVAFDLEESLHGGSEVLAQELKGSGTDVAGMLSLEMLGFRTEHPGSQRLPDSLRAGFPQLVAALAERKFRGDFLALIADEAAAPTAQALAEAGKLAGVAMLPIVLPKPGLADPAVRRSDHAPFWDAGFPAVLLTDTADYRSDAYHTKRDVPASLDYEFMAAIVSAVAQVVEKLAGASR